MYYTTVPQFIKRLEAVNTYLDKLNKYADAKKFDANVVLQDRLAPDMYPFVKQVQIACDFAKGTAARLIGQEPPKHEDNEKTVGELRTRIDKTVQYLKSLNANDFKGCEDRRVDIFFLPGKWLTGFDYVYEMALPNFYFHLTSAYAILRKNGVDVGKMDYLGPIEFRS